MPVVNFQFVLPVGSAADPSDRPGLAGFTADMLDEGAGRRPMVELHDALARIGSQIDLEITPDGTILSLTTLSRHTARALSLLADIAARPRLEPTECERVRELRLSRLHQLRDVASAVADRVFARALYGDHPYGHSPLGNEVSLRAIARDEVAAFHEARWRPCLATLVAVGDIEHEAVAAAAFEAFSEWGSAPGEAVPLSSVEVPEPTPASAATLLVHRSGAPQSEIRVGRLGARRTSPHFYPLLVLNTILGGQFVSRINLNLREDKGYTYGARSGFDFRRGRGPFVVQVSVQTDATATSVREILREIRDFVGGRPPTDGEIEAARGALTRGYPRGFETAAQVARGFAQLALYNMPDETLAEFVPRVRGVDRDALTAAAAAHIDADDYLAVIVGDREIVSRQFAEPPVELPLWEYAFKQ